MLPPFTKRDMPPRQVLTTDRTKHRRNSNYSIQLPSSDSLSLEMGHSGSSRREKSMWAVKDKVLEPHQFFLSTTFQNCKRQLRQARWQKLLMAVIIGFFILTYWLGLLSSNVKDVTLEEQDQIPIPSQTRDQLILYRIVGNDLPPRHKEGQTLSNLRFILEHEPAFPNTRKLFVLNRISDPQNEATIIRLLNEYGVEYIRIPFEEKVYENIDFRLEDFPEPDYLHSDDYRRFSKVKKLRALDYTYHDKNLYAMNNNGGRNTAIEHAQSIPNAKWVMPFDGNCFLSNNGFAEIKSQLDRFGGDIKYFVVPMTRLLNNTVLLDNTEDRPKAPEEPQIIFRYDATEEYNLNMRYGRRSKLELLWRLGALENRRLNRPTVPWESSERPYSKDKGNFRTIGWVFRLFSGNPQQEENKKEASSIRGFNRLLAIQSSLDSLDESIARRTFRQDKLFVFDEKDMAKVRYHYWANEPDVVAVVDRLQEQAATMLHFTQQQLDPMSAAAAATAADPLQRMDPQTNDDQFLASLPKEAGIEYLGPLTHNVTVLTLASYFLGDDQYGRCAANLIRVHFLNEYAVEDEDAYSGAREEPDTSHLLDFLSDQGYSFPSLNRIPQIIRKHNSNRIFKTSDLTKTDVSSLLDSMRILRRMQLLTHKEYINLQAITAEFLEYHITSPTGIHLAQMADHRGVFYDLQVTALSAFANDVRLFLRVANRCRMRIGKQFTPEGNQPFQKSTAQARLQQQLSSDSFNMEDKDPSLASALSWRVSLHYETLNLQYWTVLAKGIQNAGVAKDVWHYTAKHQETLSHTVVSHLKRNYGILDSLSPVDEAFARARLRPLAYMAESAFGNSFASGKLILTEKQKEDQNWIKNHVRAFGARYLTDVDPQGILEDMVREDELKGRMGIPPFWMLATLSS
ncbi:hypothetical protein J3Q64DRAFT_1811276 [Phycomyces blakesleeanus]|uniref:Alginate lyase domain-containing protein n=2 Tax=Phycomyces blakesleeanus TaxID=4837 RepID=A0A162TJ11_PHYB8|nr:hypothetical protein PHYBLDRAFT_189017 [Phycomyces blakesleeanus NRRL 1555(-)]OAD67533.1 hypothetical protein PHYBLDRAFT_189017 [Phycomyces blakesleeanus NRRL 1555(-)]|eukprot:XP_018285573.1 hypothetical protein PHYBLDRAFT_189017 [Phycomyces blakesleeanus NRRL 1555(-)]